MADPAAESAPHRSFPTRQQCARANKTAVFMPGTEPDTLPCIQVGGVQAYLYLDAKDQVVRVAVHLDTTEEALLQTDQTVPLEIVVNDTIVFDPTGRTADTVLTDLLDAANGDQEPAIRAAAIAAGLQWQCRCGWYNPAAERRCENCPRQVE